MRRPTEVNFEDRDVIVPTEELIIVAAGYGRWQIFITIILCLMNLTHMLNAGLEPVQHMAGWWCEKPAELRNWTDAQWIMFSHVNVTRRGFTEELINERFRGCKIYKHDFSYMKSMTYEMRPLIDRPETVQCSNIHYSQVFGKSIAEKFNKGCDPTFEDPVWHAAIVTGEVLGYIIFGYLTDRVGRKPVLFTSCGLTPLTAIGVSFAPNYLTYVIVRTIHDFLHGGFIASFILVIEISNNVWRTRMTSLALFFYALGIGLAPVLFKVVTSIDHLVLLVNEPCVLFLLAINFLPESPAWLFCTRNSLKLRNVIIKAAKTNQNPLPSQFQVVYIEHQDVEKQLPKARPKFWDLLQAPEITCEIAGIGYLISLSGVIFGSTQAKLVFNEKRVSHWYAIMGLDAMSGIMISQFCVLMMGHRKLLHVTVFLIFITTGALMINLREDYLSTTGPTTTLLAANIFAISLNYGAIINYSVRTVPTLLRGTYLGIWNALWAIFTWAGVKKYLNYPGMSSTAIITILLAALVTLNIRDLLWRELPDTVNDSVNFKDKPKPKRWSLTEQ